MKRLFFAAALVAAFSLPASAQLIASDSYQTGSNLAAGQYPDGTALSNATALAGLVTPGFVNGRYGSGTGTAQFSASSVGLAYSSLGITSTDSGKVAYAATGLDNTFRSTARNLSPTAPVSSTYWVSSLVNRGTVSATTGRDYVMAGFGGAAGSLDINTAGTAGLFFGFSGDNGNLAIRYRSAGAGSALNNTIETTLLAGSSASDNVTYELLFKIESGFAGGVADRVTYWVSPSSFTSEATLSSTAIATGVLTDTNILSANTDLVRLNYMSKNWNSSAFFDEVRLGTTLGSVTAGAPVVVPEAGTTSLLLTGGLGLIGLVLRKRKA